MVTLGRTDGDLEVSPRDIAEQGEVLAALDDGEALVLVGPEEPFCEQRANQTCAVTHDDRTETHAARRGSCLAKEGRRACAA